MTERYADLGGGCHDRWDGVIDNRCPECGVEPGQKCWNAISKSVKRLPCIKRCKVVSG